MVYIVTALLLCLLWYKTKNKSHLNKQIRLQKAKISLVGFGVLHHPV